MLELERILKEQKTFFNSFATKSYQFRLKQLNILKFIVKENEARLISALKSDLSKDNLEAYMCEIGLVYAEIDFQIKNLKNNMKEKRVRTPLMLFKASSSYIFEPLGQVLIVAPFNYPVQLLLIPLIGAIATGNTIVLKPSEQVLNTSNLLMELLNKSYDQKYIHVVDPNLSIPQLNSVLDYRYDLIFFTGSTRVGQIVLEKASKYLTPVILELGGKSPCIVDSDANVKMAAKRIVFGKLINAGQTCIAPDYILVNEAIKEKFIQALILEIKEQYIIEQYASIINEATIDRLSGYLNSGEIRYGGNYDKDKLLFEPTIIEVIDFNNNIMLEEIFGPIIPIISFDNLDEQLNNLTNKEKPLVLYYFGQTKKVINKVINNTQSGDIVINDTLIHASSSYLPFGGVGHSGMGSYHGNHSFSAFSYKRSILKRSLMFEFSMRFMPYSKKNEKLVKKVMK